VPFEKSEGSRPGEVTPENKIFPWAHLSSAHATV